MSGCGGTYHHVAHIYHRLGAVVIVDSGSLNDVEQLALILMHMVADAAAGL